MRWICRGATAVGRQRKRNEDQLWISAEPACACAVVDGMGGQSTGDIAAGLAVAALSRYAFDDEERALDEVARDAMLRAHEAVREPRAREKYYDFAATAVLLVRRGAELAVAHAGACCALLLRDGALERLTVDHSLSEELARQPSVTRAEIEDARARYPNVVTRALGFDAPLSVDTALLEARRGDVLVLCSDGVLKCVAPETLLAILTQSPSVDAACEQLLAALRDAVDDHTFVIAKLLD